MNKTSIIECVENLYGLATNYLKRHDSQKLKSLMLKLQELEYAYISCSNYMEVKEIGYQIKELLIEMEVIMNE